MKPALIALAALSSSAAFAGQIADGCYRLVGKSTMICVRAAAAEGIRGSNVRVAIFDNSGKQWCNLSTSTKVEENTTTLQFAAETKVSSITFIAESARVGTVQLLNEVAKYRRLNLEADKFNEIFEAEVCKK